MRRQSVLRDERGQQGVERKHDEIAQHPKDQQRHQFRVTADERERESLDRSAAQRIADERRIAAQRDLADRAARSTYTLEPSNPENYAGYAPYDSGLAWGYPPYPGALSPRSRYPRGYAPPRFRPGQRFMARRSTVHHG